jgi:hypothetical protein
MSDEAESLSAGRSGGLGRVFGGVPDGATQGCSGGVALMANVLLCLSSGIGTVVAPDPGTGKVVRLEKPPAAGPPAQTSLGVASRSGDGKGSIIALVSDRPHDARRKQCLGFGIESVP